jgi:hypothetical protein
VQCRFLWHQPHRHWLFWNLCRLDSQVTKTDTASWAISVSYVLSLRSSLVYNLDRGFEIEIAWFLLLNSNVFAFKFELHDSRVQIQITRFPFKFKLHDSRIQIQITQFPHSNLNDILSTLKFKSCDSNISHSHFVLVTKNENHNLLMETLTYTNPNLQVIHDH